MSVASHRKRHIRIPGPRRSARLLAEEEQRALLPQRHQEAIGYFIATRGRIQPRGLKRQFIPGTEYEGEGEWTLYFNKEVRRRRKARRRAHESRRVNHAARCTAKRLRQKRRRRQLG